LGVVTISLSGHTVDNHFGIKVLGRVLSDGLNAGFGNIEKYLLDAVSKVEEVQSNEALSVESGAVNCGGDAEIGR
jgi:hypothetical protein